jgi:ABC-type lipoprotein export system ATPase subunit
VSTPAAPQATATQAPAAARTADLTKVYGSGDTRVTALGGVTVDIQQGRFTAVMGPSGSGKSTFMHCLAGLDRPSSGEVWIGDTELSKLKDDALTTLRRDAVGFIFQAFNLVPTLTALENITLPLDIAGRKVDKEWLDQVVTTVGLADRLGHKPAQLSGGQQQRVACARALVSKPRMQTTQDLKDQVGGFVNQLLYVVYGLLILSIVIAALGVINTMAMAVLERTREIGLLRAIGLTRRQSRRMIRRESVLIALLGAVLGVATGVLVGIALQQSTKESVGIDKLALPYDRLPVFFVIAGIVGVVSALAPARRAARMDVLQAIATE